MSIISGGQSAVRRFVQVSVWRPSSLARMARREKARLATEPAYLRVRKSASSRVVSLLRDEMSFVWLAIIALPMLFQPWFAGLNVFGKGDDPSVFIEALWQVQATALGLSLAVVLFVFQSVYGNRLGGSLRDFAEETWLFPIFYAGLLGLMLDGVVLLRVGQGAPSGWAASWAVIWAAGTAASLAFLFVSTIRAIDPGALHQLRLRRSSHAIEREIEDVIFRRVALVLLQQWCEGNAVELVPLFGQSPNRSALTVRARREGEVRTIQLRRLKIVAAAAARRDLPMPRLRATIGLPVRAGTELVWIDATQKESVLKLTRAFRVRSRDRKQFRTTVDDLHDEALVAIRTPSPAAYSAISELYEQMLLALPETWARYGQKYVGDVASGANPFELTAQDYLERNLYEEMTLAAKSGSRDVAHDSLDLPITVAERALDIGALALSGRMIQLWVAARRSMLRDADSDDTRNLLKWSWLRMSEYARRPEMRITEDNATPDSQSLGKDALLQVWDGYATLCKAILDTRPGDTDLLGELNGVWNEPLTHWAPEHADPQIWHLEYATRRGDDDAVVARIREELAENQRLVAIKHEIVDWRALHRFGLLVWIFRDVRDRGDGDRLVPAWQMFAGYFGDLARLAVILDKGVAADWEDRGRWTNWVLDSLPKRASYGVAVDLEFVQTFVVLGLSLISPEGPPPRIDPLQFSRGRLEDPRATVKAIVESENLKPLLPADRLDERAEQLITALELMQTARKTEEEQATIDAPVALELVDSFAATLRGAWRSSRTVRDAFAAVGTVETVQRELIEASGSQIKHLLHKDLFVADSRLHGMEHIAKEYGQGLARLEWHTLLRAADEVPASAGPADAPISDRLSAAVAELRDEGFVPSLMIAPMNWRLFQALKLTAAPNRGGDAQPPAWLRNDDDRGGFLGTVDGVPVLEQQHATSDRLVVLDLGRFAKFREQTPEDARDPVSVEVTSYDEAAIRELIRTMDFDADLDDDAKVRIVQQRVLLYAHYPYGIEVLDNQAARYVAVPEDLTEL